MAVLNADGQHAGFVLVDTSHSAEAIHIESPQEKACMDDTGTIGTWKQSCSQYRYSFWNPIWESRDNSLFGKP